MPHRARERPRTAAAAGWPGRSTPAAGPRPWRWQPGIDTAARCEGPQAFARMLAVIGKVGNIVDDIDGRGQEAEGEEGHDRRKQQADIGDFVVEDQRHHDQDVLEPLVHADGFEDRQRRDPVKRQHFRFMAVSPAAGGPVGCDDDGAPRRIEHHKIIAAVACVIKAAITAQGNQPFALAAGRQVLGVGRMQDAIEKAEVVGDRPGRGFGRTRDQPDRLPGVAGQPDPLDDLGPVGPFVAVSHVAGGNLPLQHGFSRTRPSQ